jgi:hypothetical protein
MADDLVVLRGGSRDGESTKVEQGVTRLLTPSDGPGLLEVYEDGGETAHVPGNSEAARVFVHAGQQGAEDVAPEALHAPTGH